MHIHINIYIYSFLLPEQFDADLILVCTLVSPLMISGIVSFRKIPISGVTKTHTHIANIQTNRYTDKQIYTYVHTYAM